MNLKSELNDNELLRLMLAGDEEAFALLYRRRQGGIYRFASQMSGPDSLADDVFMFLMREGHTFDPSKGTLSAFLLGVARVYVRRRLKAEHRLEPLGHDLDDDAPFLQQSDMCPLEDLTRAETIESVRRA